MPASEAQIAAARANGSRSRGPVSPEGKARSRANSYKHGMAGEGVVLPADDSAEVARRSAQMQAEMAPKTAMGRFLVDRLAELTVRVERCSEQERAAIALRAAHAGADFDEARAAEVDRALARIAEEPATLARKLRSMPEGVDRLIARLLELRDVLEAGRWDLRHGEMLTHLTGRGWADVPVARPRALSEAIGGDPGGLRAGDGAGLSDPDRVSWASARIRELIDAEVEALRAHRSTLDLEAIEFDRDGAADRSAFDPSREAILARRYEAAAERGVYRALRELRQVEAEAAEIAPAEIPKKAAAVEAPGSFGAGSSRPAGSVAPTRPPVAPTARPVSVAPVGTGPGWSEVAITVGRRSA